MAVIKSLHIESFTVFSQAALEFGKHLNVFVGENGTGKSHLLKLAYSMLAVEAQGRRESNENTPREKFLQGAIARKLIGVFRPDGLGRLTQRRGGGCRCSVHLEGTDPDMDLAFEFNAKSEFEVSVTKVPSRWLDKHPVFLPSRELLTMYPGFVSLYDTTTLPLEETWRDSCVLLGAPLARGPREGVIKSLLEPLEQALGGKIVLESSGGFYLVRTGARTEMHLVAEGLRKLAMVARLIATGTLVDKGYLFWDEPDTSLNSRLIKDIAQAIVHVSRCGIQVFVATHSLFLLRELYMLREGLDTRCFGLHPTAGGSVTVEQGPTIDDIGSIASLDEELYQSERYMIHEAAEGSRS